MTRLTASRHPRHGARITRFIASGLVAAAVVAGAMPARAALLPDASVSGTVIFNLGGRQDLASFGSIGLDDARFGSVAFGASAAPAPSLTAEAQIGPNDLGVPLFGRGAGFMTYYIEILGPAAVVPVVVEATGSATASASPGGSFAVVSQWQLFDSGSFSTVLAGDEIRSGQLTGSFGQEFSHSIELTLATNHLYPVVLLADAAAAATDLVSKAFATAFIDPVFSFGAGIDPAVFSFVFSAGIGNELPAPPPTGSVPEPGTLALLSAALLWVSRGLRRRRGGAAART